jgi:multimeric flavodoxin WrbA
MRIMSILGSPRDSGTTATVLGWVEQSLSEQGHDVEHVHVIRHKIEDCQECWGCKSGGLELCAVDDDATELMRRMVAADLVLFAAPLFCWGFPARMKALVDRMYCLVDDFHDNPDYASRLEGKPLALLVTSGGGDEGNADLLIQAFGNMVRFLKARDAGHLHVPFCTGPDSLGEEARRKASEFAERLRGAA